MRIVVVIVLLAGLAACAATPPRSSLAERIAEVTQVERAFARTMSDRDLAAFSSFLDEEAVFVSGSKPLRGKREITDAWRQYFEDDTAPFSWAPETVTVLDSGHLALSTGPVLDRSGNQVAIFTSIWRREGRGPWRIIFDRGTDYCR